MLTTALYTDEIASLAVSDFTDDTAAAVVVSTPSYTLPLFPLAALAMPYPAQVPFRVRDCIQDRRLRPSEGHSLFL